MRRTLFVLSTVNGYVADVVSSNIEYTDDPERALTFTSAEIASTRAQHLLDLLPDDLTIQAVQLNFPRKTPVRHA